MKFDHFFVKFILIIIILILFLQLLSLEECPPNLKIISGDVRDVSKVKQVVEGQDVLVTTIGMSSSFSCFFAFILRFFYFELLFATIFLVLILNFNRYTIVIFKSLQTTIC